MAYFAASVDDPETNRRFAESLELTYPILSDPGKGTAKAYGALMKVGVASRVTFYIGKDGKILLVDRAVQSATAGEDLVRHLGELRIDRR